MNKANQTAGPVFRTGRNRRGAAPRLGVLQITVTFFLFFNLVSIFSVRSCFAGENSDLREKIKWLNMLEASLKEETGRKTALEKRLTDEESANLYLNQELKQIKLKFLSYLNTSIREKRNELDSLIKERSLIARELSKINPAGKAANKKAYLIKLKEQKIRAAEIEEIKNQLEARIFSLETELALKSRQLETAIRDKTEKEKELRDTIEVFRKEKSVLEKAMQFQLDNCASLQNTAKEKQDLEGRLIALKTQYQKQMAGLYYYLGLAYTQAKVYPEAINSYSMSLQYAPENLEAHYNLGLLYQYQENNPEKAVYHFRRCLTLAPDIQKRRTIESLIEVLSK